MTAPDLKIVGVGNRYRGDDAVGLLVIDLLEAYFPGQRLARSDGEITGLLEHFQSHEHVVLIDAVQADEDPDSILHLDGRKDSLGDTGLRSSTHAMGVAEAVEMARSLDCLPRCLTIFGIVGSNFDNGERLSDPVAVAARKLARQIHEKYGDQADGERVE